MAIHLYILPIERNLAGTQRGPKYFFWRFDPDPPGIQGGWAMMDYGFLDYALLVSNLSDADHAFLLAQPDVYSFPQDLNAQISDGPVITAFFEAINIPTDWLTPSTTYLEFLRQMAGLFQFNQRYGGISNGQSLLGNGVTLDNNWNNLSQQQKQWFNQTIASFGYIFNVTGNPKLRALAKQAGDLWGAQAFYLGGIQF